MTPPVDVVVRVALPSDAEPLARLHVEIEEELRALYVRASWWDRRVGHALLTAAVGERAAYLWVLEGNDRAIGFYRRQGFAEDGETRRDDHGTELRMTRERQSSTRTSSARWRP